MSPEGSGSVLPSGGPATTSVQKATADQALVNSRLKDLFRKNVEQFKHGQGTAREDGQGRRATAVRQAGVKV